MSEIRQYIADSPETLSTQVLHVMRLNGLFDEGSRLPPTVLADIRRYLQAGLDPRLSLWRCQAFGLYPALIVGCLTHPDEPPAARFLAAIDRGEKLLDAACRLTGLKIPVLRALRGLSYRDLGYPQAGFDRFPRVLNTLPVAYLPSTPLDWKDCLDELCSPLERVLSRLGPQRGSVFFGDFKPGWGAGLYHLMRITQRRHLDDVRNDLHGIIDMLRGMARQAALPALLRAERAKGHPVDTIEDIHCYDLAQLLEMEFIGALFDGIRLTRLVQISRCWHQKRKQLHSLGFIRSTDPWPALFESPVYLGVCDFKVITDTHDLWEESQALAHCADDYKGPCIAAMSHIVAMTNRHTGSRSTLEIHLADNGEIELIQHCGYDNQAPSQADQATAVALIGRLQSGAVAVNREAIRRHIEHLVLTGTWGLNAFIDYIGYDPFDDELYAIALATLESCLPIRKGELRKFLESHQALGAYNTFIQRICG